MNLVGWKLTFIIALVNETQNALSMLASCSILSLVYFSVWPSLPTFAMLLILQPFSNITGSISMGVCTCTTGFIIQPLSFVDITIWVIQHPLSICLIGLPFPDIARPICPNLFSISFPLPVLPLPFVSNSIIQLYSGHLHPPLRCYHLTNQLVINCVFSPTDEVLTNLFFLPSLLTLLFLRLSLFFSMVRSYWLSASKLRWSFEFFRLLYFLFLFLLTLFFFKLQTVSLSLLRFGWVGLGLIDILYLFEDFLPISGLDLHIRLIWSLCTCTNTYSHVRL